MDANRLSQKIEAAGVVGAGGAGFPTHKKLAAGIDTVLVNASECEPLLYTDLAVLQQELDRVVRGALAFREALGAKRALIGMKLHTAERLGFSDGELLGGALEVVVMPDAYPMGDEIVMIYQLLHLVVPPGQLPSSVGVVVINVETAYNVANALDDIPVTEKWVTLGGDIAQPCVVRVPINCGVKNVLDAAGITVPEGHVVIDGGPMMGNIINPLTAKITKKTKSLLVLPDTIAAVTFKIAPVEQLLKRTPSACCQCSYCTDMCPRYLLGYPLAPHKTLRAVGTNTFTTPDDLLTASLCSGCGLCTLIACCQGIAPSATMVEVKRALGKNRLAYKATASTVPHMERDWRMVPISRVISRIGVAPYNKPTPYAGTLAVTQPIFALPLSQHVGKPSVPIVAAGDTVRAGQMIARADEGISAALHTPFGGTVLAVSATQIEIKMGEVR